MPVFISSLWLVQFLDRLFEFEWDEGNKEKNLKKHGHTNAEIEECFYDLDLVLIGECIQPKFNERRFAVIGKNTQELLFIVFTIRNNLIRVISARTATTNEREKYEQQKES